MDIKVLGDQLAAAIIGADEICGGWVEVVGDRYDNHYLRGTDCLGALPSKPLVQPRVIQTNRGRVLSRQVPPRMGFMPKVTAQGRKFIGVGVTNHKQLTSEQVIKNAQDIGKRAQDVGKKLLAQVAKTAKIQKLSGVHGPVPRGLNHPALSLNDIKKIANDTIKSGKALIAGATKHQSQHSAHLKKVASGAKAAGLMLTPNAPHSVIGEAIDELHYNTAVYDVLGEVLGDATAQPDPNNPGYLTDGTIDPNYQGGSGGGTVPTDQAAASYGGGADVNGVPGPQDNNYGCGPAPTPQSVTQEFTDPSSGSFQSEVPGQEQSVYTGATMDDLNTLVPGAIPFSFDLGAQHIPPFKAITSYNTYHPNALGQADGGKDGDGVGAGFEWHGTEGSRWMVYWPNNSSSVNPPSSDEAANLDVMSDHSVGHNWGPLLGAQQGSKTGRDPIASSDWQGLRYLRGSGTAGAPIWFWHRDAAPQWAMAPFIADQYQKELLAYNTALTAGKQNYAAAVVQDALNKQQAAAAAAAQAAQDAQTAHDQAQETQSAQHQADLDAITQNQQFQQQQQQQQLDLAQQQESDQAKTAYDAAMAQQQAQADIQQAEASEQLYEQQAQFDAQYAAQYDQAPQTQSADAGDGSTDGSSLDDLPSDRGQEDRQGDVSAADLMDDAS